MIRVDRDEVEDGLRRPLGTAVADQEAARPAGVILGDPGRPGEVSEPGTGDERPHLAAGEPVVDDGRDRRLIRLCGSTEAGPDPAVRHREDAAARPEPSASWSATSGQPWTSSR